MWTKEHRCYYPNVSPEIIWKLWADINHWPRWHGDLEYCKLEGCFKVGHYFILKPKGAPEVKVTLTSINEMQDFTDCTHFFGAKMYDTHSLVVQKGGVVISNKLVVSGPLTWLWVKLVANKVAASVPHEMNSLARLARKMSEEHA